MIDTDRELLEYAAKAAEIEWFGYYGDDTVECQYLDIGTNDVVPWNPLTDDGDALRLAVRCLPFYTLRYTREDYEACNQDGLAATRRAIVRAAAEIGKAMV